MSVQLPSIPEFFRGSSVFITGGSGFMGKVLIEKLLRSCPDIGKIYLLLRTKRGKTPSERIDSITALQLFDVIRKSNPDSFSKLVAVQGDVTELRLGMREEDRTTLQSEVSVIFHTAASVRFDDPIEKAVIINVRGTREVVDLAQGMTKLKVLLHVSTAYCNSDRTMISEKIYPAHGDWRTMIQLCEQGGNTRILDALTPKITSSLPNTYTYAKSLTEHLIQDYEHLLPVVIFRPSIVVSTSKEPVPGWIDNFNGPVGLSYGVAKGIMRSVYGDPDAIVDYVPVDLSIKAMIAAAWQRAVYRPVASVPVYNNCNMIQPVSASEMADMGTKINEKYPVDKLIWLPSVQYTTNIVLHIFKVLVLQLLPALILDGFMLLRGQKPMLMKLQRKIFAVNMALSYFMFRTFRFEVDNFKKLQSSLMQEDISNFGYLDEGTDLYSFLVTSFHGARLYLLNDTVDNIPQARKHYRKMFWLDRISKAVLLLFSLWLVKCYILNSVIFRLTGHAETVASESTNGQFLNTR